MSAAVKACQQQVKHALLTKALALLIAFGLLDW
jgi:hypothetical protein